jgi:hypothetical protein
MPIKPFLFFVSIQIPGAPVVQSITCFIMPQALYADTTSNPKTDDQKALALTRKFFDKPKNEKLRHQLWGIDSYPFEALIKPKPQLPPTQATSSDSSSQDLNLKVRDSLSDSESDNLDDEDLFEDTKDQPTATATSIDEDVYDDEIYVEDAKKIISSADKKAKYDEGKRNFNMKAAG